MQNDYIMRQIEAMAKMLGELVFHRTSEIDEIIDEEGTVSGEGFLAYTLNRLLDGGKINEAEDLLHAELAAYPSPKGLEVAVAFYKRLAAMSEAELRAADFSPEEITEGLEASMHLFSRN